MIGQVLKGRQLDQQQGPRRQREQHRRDRKGERHVGKPGHARGQPRTMAFLLAGRGAGKCLALGLGAIGLCRRPSRQLSHLRRDFHELDRLGKLKEVARRARSRRKSIGNMSQVGFPGDRVRSTR